MRAWFSGWATTLHIMIFERETYRFLRDLNRRGFTEVDFVEVERPEA